MAVVYLTKLLLVHDCIASDNWMTLNNELWRMWKRAVWPDLR